MDTRTIGAPVHRTEDPRLLRGEGRYLDDLSHDAYEIVLVRSPHAHARVLSVDVSDAVDVDGLLAIITYEDLPEHLQDPLPVLLRHPSLHHPRTQFVLAKDEVNYAGEAVVLVVATDRYAAEDAAERISVDYSPLPSVVGLGAAARADVLVHEDVPANEAGAYQQLRGDPAGAIDAAEHVLEFTLDIERSAAMPMETRGVFASWNERDDKLTVFSSTQSPASVRNAVAAYLGLERAQVDCIAPDMGGGFGMKLVHPWPEELLVPWMAMALDHDVKFVEDRSEHFVASAHERAQRHDVKVGFDGAGVVAGIEIDFLHDNGSYVPYGMIVPIITTGQVVGPYRLENLRVAFRSMYTNTVTVAPYRGAGRPQACYVMERTMDRIAAHLDLDRTEVRFANLIQPEEMPYDFGLTFQDGRSVHYDSGDFPACLQRAKELVDWDGFASRQERAKREGRLLGLGIAAYVEGTGVGPYEGGAVSVDPSGIVHVSTGLSSQGQGHATTFAQVVAERLGVSLADIRVVTGDTRRVSHSIGTFASRAAVVSGSAVYLAADKVREKALVLASQALEVSVEDLELDDGEVRVVGSPGTSVSLGVLSALSDGLRYAFDAPAREAVSLAGPIDLAAPPLAEGDAPGLAATEYFSPLRATFANGVQAVEIEVDPVTSEVRFRRYVVVHDCGTLINPKIVEGQVRGGVAQGIAGALLERLAYDDQGQLANASFMDFLMPYATEIPELIIDHLETPSPLNPLGVKGAGEAGVIPAAAAIASALEDAIGVTITSMPLSPSDIHTIRGVGRTASGLVEP